MQEWFSASYFSNDLPLRRASENTFRSLQIIKEETRSDDRPFLTKTAPKLPPNLPIPGFAGNNMLGQPSPSIGQASLSNGSDTLPPNDTLRQMLADLQQTQLGGQHIQTPMRNAVLGAASPAISVGRIATDPFANPASYASSPVSQHAMPARSAWETAASPALSRAAVSSPFGGAQHLGGFPQPQFAQQRSIFDVPSPQQPLGQAPYPPSPWGMQMPPQMAHQMHQQPFPTSPFAQMPQQPFAPYPGQPMNQPWQQPQFMQPPQQQQQPMGSPAAMPQHPGQQLAAPETPVAQPQSVSPVPAPQQVLSPSPASAQPALELAKSPVPATAVVTSPVPAVSIPTPTPQAWATIPAVVASPIVQKSEPERIPEFERIVSPVPVKAAPAPIAAKPSKEEKQVKAVEAAAQPIQPESRTSTPPIAAPSVAPWAEDKGKANKSMSLKEIQEVEAKAAEKKKAVEAKARAAAAAAQPIADSTEMLQSITYGLASRPAMTTSNSTGAASLPVWGATTPTGSKKQMPKRSLQQIQEEEHAKKVSTCTYTTEGQLLMVIASLLSWLKSRLLLAQVSLRLLSLLVLEGVTLT
jgi:PERQ amino acid-rich with GYF domain-containing protein